MQCSRPEEIDADFLDEDDREFMVRLKTLLEIEERKGALVRHENCSIASVLQSADSPQALLRTAPKLPSGIDPLRVHGFSWEDIDLDAGPEAFTMSFDATFLFKNPHTICLLAVDYNDDKDITGFYYCEIEIYQEPPETAIEALQASIRNLRNTGYPRTCRFEDTTIMDHIHEINPQELPGEHCIENFLDLLNPEDRAPCELNDSVRAGTVTEHAEVWFFKGKEGIHAIALKPIGFDQLRFHYSFFKYETLNAN